VRAGISTQGKGHHGAEVRGNGLGRLAKGFKKQWKGYQKGLRSCQKELSEEAIHDLRVGTRRLLATLKLLHAFLAGKAVKQIACALKQHLDEFDELRDTQVGLKLTKPLRTRFAAARDFHKHLLDCEKRFTRRTRKRIKKVKLGPARKVVQDCRRQLESKVDACSRDRANALLLRAIAQAFARVRRYRAAIDARNARTIHRTRVAFKEFRYMIEALSDCLPFATNRQLDAMHDYQTMMGDVQDAQVLLTSVDKFLSERDSDPRMADRFRKELLRRRETLIKKYLSCADRLEKFWPD
jgi:CHAD domain-containing protein